MMKGVTAVSKEYVLLFNTITDMIEEMEAMVSNLKEVQRQTEESIIAKR